MDKRVMNVFSAELEKAAASQFIELMEMDKEAGFWSRVFGRGGGEAAEQALKAMPEEQFMKQLGAQFGKKGPGAKALKGVASQADLEKRLAMGALGPADEQILKRLQRRGRQQAGTANPFKDLKNVDELAEAYKANPGLQQQISGLQTGQKDLMKQLGGAQAGREAAEQSMRRWQMGTLGAGAAGIAGMGAMSHMANRPQAPGAPMINYSPGQR